MEHVHTQNLFGTVSIPGYVRPLFFLGLHVPFISRLQNLPLHGGRSMTQRSLHLDHGKDKARYPYRTIPTRQFSISAPFPVNSSAWHLWQQKMDCFQERSGLAQLRIKACSQTQGGEEKTASHLSLLETRILRLHGCQFGSICKWKWMITGKKIK